MKKTIFIASAIIILTASIAAKFLFSNFYFLNSSPDVEAAADKTGLVGYWTMDTNNMSPTGATMYDRSGQNNHGTMTGTTTSTGRIGQSRTFNGTSDYIEMGDVLDMDASDEATLSAWIKTTQNDTNYRGIIYKWEAGAGCASDAGQSYGMNVRSGLIYTGVNSDNGSDNAAASDRTVNDGKWHHAVFSVKDGANNYNQYIDGANSFQGTKSGTGIKNSSTAFRVGVGEILCYGLSSVVWNGQIDDVRIYNRALSAAEVTQLYNSTNINRENTAVKASSTPSGAGQLVGWWTMDNSDRSRNLVYDRSGLNNNGTLTGTTTSTGKIGQARSFNGTNDKISVSDVDMAAGSSTFSVWFKSNAWSTVIAGKSADADTYIYPFNSTRIDVQTDTALTVKNFTVPAMLFGNWYHLAVIRSGNTTRVYLNGVESSSGGQTQTDVLTINQIGTYSSGSLWWNGDLDDIRIYNYALSAQEVANLYNAAKTTHANTPTKTGLVGYWNMDNSDRSGNLIYDRSGFNNSGTITGATTSTGVIKQARSFNGSTNRINVADSNSLDLGNNLTIAAWVKPSVCGSSPNGGTIATKEGWSYYTEIDTSCKPQIYLSGTSPAAYHTGNNAISLNKWTFLTWTFDGSQAGIFENGVLDRYSTGITGNLTLTTGVLSIGQLSGPGAYGFNGSIDELRIYNYTMSAQEVANLYNAAKATFAR